MNEEEKRQLKKRIQKKLLNNMTYKYNGKYPTYIKPEELTEEQLYRLTESKTFCMMPWTHLHAFPDGRAYPCCLSLTTHPIGNFRDQTMQEVWNDKPLRDMRVKMLSDQPTKECVKCYEQEDMGFFSMRNSSNKAFGHHITSVDTHTRDNGTYDEFKLRYYDVRFSNICNFKCRTCGPTFSSHWYKDEVKLYGPRSYPQITIAGRHKDDMWEQMQEHIPHIEQIYFAGGEPLIMEEHYRILRELVDRELFHVRLQYNTNFSELKFKGQDVLELWKLFDDVSIGASLDGSYARGEYIRKGQNWAETVENRERMLKVCPKVDFYINSTVSIYNVLHVPDFHREWVDLGLLKPQDWNINILQGPDYDRINILPQYYKDLAKEKIISHINWLEPQDKLTRATNGYKSLLNFMSQDSGSTVTETELSGLLQEFFKRNYVLDKLRDEDFYATFPEYADLKKYAR
jgi:radical SAM protein with 4Fe4S-binding SPASM domain